MEPTTAFILVAGIAFAVIAALAHFSGQYGLNSIKAKPIGNGQHGTARFATRQEIVTTYRHVPYQPRQWRKGMNLPTEQGIILGVNGRFRKITALVDTDDVHTLMIGASGVGKTAFFLYPNLEYACATGMSFITTDTKGDLYRNYGGIAKEYYGYEIAVIDLRNPTLSDGYNMLSLVNKYMDQWLANPDDITAKSKAEKYAKIIAKTIIASGGDTSNYGQNAYFYDSAEGIIAATILLLAEFLPAQQQTDGKIIVKRHIVSVFKLIQDLMAPAEDATPGSKKQKKENRFQELMKLLPSEHKAKWLAGAALNTSDQSMVSVLSTAMSRLNAFLDTELEQILCFDTTVDAEIFCTHKSAIFLTLPEEDTTKYFLASLFLQQFYRELLMAADSRGGKLDNRVMIYADELGTMPAIQSIEQMFSAGRSRRIALVPIIQGLAQLEKNYGKEGAEIILDNCQDTIFGGFAPQSQTAEVLSKALGNQTVLSGSVSRGKNDPSQSLQMIERPLMTADELKSIPKGNFVVMKTGTHPMKTKMPLFLKWGIKMDQSYIPKDKGNRAVFYADHKELACAIKAKYPSSVAKPLSEVLAKEETPPTRYNNPLRKGAVMP